MSGDPLVTVTIPTYNRAHLLRESLESVLAQTVKRLEVIVSDNASTDATADVVASFRDPRVSYTRLERNLGHLANLSRCLGLGTAPLVMIFQDDDLMLPHNIERKLEVLEADEGIVFVHSAFSFIDDEGQVLNEKASWWDAQTSIESPEQFVRGTLEWGLRVDLSSPLMRRRFVQGERFEEEEGLAADHGFYLRLGRKGKVAYLDEPLTASRRHASAISVTQEAHLLEGGYYAPSFRYSSGCRVVNKRFLDRYGSEYEDVSKLRRIARSWSRRDLASIVRANTGYEPSMRSTARHISRAAKIDPTVLATRKLLLVTAWTLIGRRGRRLARRILNFDRRS
ncbi:MAG: glycosyltransferase family A protein [Gaiellaceae bacterium]